jgi:hypothetical protein
MLALRRFECSGLNEAGISDGGTGTYFMAFRNPTPWASFLPLEPASVIDEMKVPPVARRWHSLHVLGLFDRHHDVLVRRTRPHDVWI